MISLEGLRIWLNRRAAKRYWNSGSASASPVLAGLTADEALIEARQWLDHLLCRLTHPGPPKIEVQSVTHPTHFGFVVIVRNGTEEQG